MVKRRMKLGKVKGKMTRKLFLVVIVFSCMILVNLSASGVFHPEALVERYYQKMQEEDLVSFVDYMHSDALTKFKAMLLPILEVGGDNSDIFQSFAQGDSLIDIQSSSSKDFFIKFYKWVMLLYPEILDGLRQSTIKPIGHISEKIGKDDIVHVVLRITTNVDGIKISKLSVVSLKKDGSEWKFLLTGELEGMVQALQQQTQANHDQGFADFKEQEEKSKGYLGTMRSAILLYYVKNEVYPQNLDVLVPGIIDEIPSLKLGRSWAGENKNTFIIDPTANTKITADDIDNSTAWIYNNKNGSIAVNNSGKDSRGISYSEW
ncbi:MAG: hypothetical protein ABII74_01675 [Elusimicrobiota bacterium]